MQRNQYAKYAQRVAHQTFKNLLHRFFVLLYMKMKGTEVGSDGHIERSPVLASRAEVKPINSPITIIGIITSLICSSSMWTLACSTALSALARAYRSSAVLCVSASDVTCCCRSWTWGRMTALMSS